MSQQLTRNEIVQKRIEAFARILQRYHPDLYQKHKENLGDPMLRQALRQIIAVRRQNARAIAARAENERIQRENKKLHRPYFS